MADHGFTTTFAVDRAPAEASGAVTSVRGWRPEEIGGRTGQPGAEFTYRHEDVHRCRIRVTQAVPGRKASWLVADNYFNFTEDETVSA
jgi:hypothetical protein